MKGNWAWKEDVLDKMWMRKHRDGSKCHGMAETAREWEYQKENELEEIRAPRPRAQGIRTRET